MPKTTGARLFAEMMRGYEVTHIFFVPAFMLKAFAEMEDMPIRRVMVHGEKAAAAALSRRRGTKRQGSECARRLSAGTPEGGRV